MGDTWAHVREWLWHLISDPLRDNVWSAALVGMLAVAPAIPLVLLWMEHGRRTEGRGAMSDDMHTVAGHGTDDTEPGTVAEEFGPMYAERPMSLAESERWEQRRQLKPAAPPPVLVRPFTMTADAYTGVHAATNQPPGRHTIPDPREHDLTAIDYAFTPRNDGRAGHIASWSAYRTDDKPLPGDYLILRNPVTTHAPDDPRAGSRYRVVSMYPCPTADPPTMWMAELVFDPRAHTDADA